MNFIPSFQRPSSIFHLSFPSFLFEKFNTLLAQSMIMLTISVMNAFNAVLVFFTVQNITSHHQVSCGQMCCQQAGALLGRSIMRLLTTLTVCLDKRFNHDTLPDGMLGFHFNFQFLTESLHIVEVDIFAGEPPIWIPSNMLSGLVRLSIKIVEYT